MREQPAQGKPGETKVSAQRLTHELAIHQIELEMQNEELRQAKAEVDAGLEKYKDLYDFAPVGYFSLDEQGVILEVNFTGAALFGVERSRVTTRRFQHFVAPQSLADFHAFLGRIFAGSEKQTYEVSLLSAGRATFLAELQAMSAVTISGARKWCRVAVSDITARKFAEEAQLRIEILAATNQKLEAEIIRRQEVEAALRTSEQGAHQLLKGSHRMQDKLRQLSHQILTVQEEQRKEISRELHDKIIQHLVGINIHLDTFIKAAAIHPHGIRQSIAPLRRLIQKSLQSVHRFACDLRPASLDDLGLIPALRSYIRNLPKASGRRIEFASIAGVEALDNAKRTVLYRVAQEALTNSSKHSQATVVKVLISKARNGVCLEVSDNGKAFDIGRIADSQLGQHLGLIGMRERVEMVGGLFSIESSAGSGTTIRAVIPFGADLEE